MSAHRYCPKCRQSCTTPIEGLDGAVVCACGWQGSDAELTATNRTLHLRPPEDMRFDAETAWCGWIGVELTDHVELARCRSCRRAAQPRAARPTPVQAVGGTMHFERARLEGEGLDVRPSLCGTNGATTPDPGLVRCRRCRRAMDVSELVEEPTPIDPSADPLPFEPGPPVPLASLGGATQIAKHFARIIERSRDGDDQSDRPRWRTLESAIAKTTAIKQGRSPMRSGFRIEQESRSEGAVRTEDGRDDVIEIDRAFARAFVRPVSITMGLHTLKLSAAVARFLLERVLRGEASASTIADELVAAGVYANRELIGRLIQDGKATMRDLLERKGLIERRDTKPDNVIQTEGSEHHMAAPHGFDLETWKEILPLLGGISETMATQLMERATDPLPVTKWFSGKVIAKREEILAWIARQTITRMGT